jgi:hypothetical protein
VVEGVRARDTDDAEVRQHGQAGRIGSADKRIRQARWVPGTSPRFQIRGYAPSQERPPLRLAGAMEHPRTIHEDPSG